jgi:TonB family protein
MRHAILIGVSMYLVFGVAVWSSPAPRRSVKKAPARILVKTFKRMVSVKKKETLKTKKLTPKESPVATESKAAPKRVPRTRKARRIRQKKVKAPTPRTVVLKNTTLEGPIVVYEGEEDVLGDPSVIKTPESSKPPPALRGEGPAESSGTDERTQELPFVAPLVLTRVKGKYPAKAPRLGRTMRVILSLKISRTGEVTRAIIVQRPGASNRVFDAEALRVVNATRFAPARRGDQAVAHTIRYVVEFSP